MAVFISLSVKTGVVNVAPGSSEICLNFVVTAVSVWAACGMVLRLYPVRLGAAGSAFCKHNVSRLRLNDGTVGLKHDAGDILTDSVHSW